MLMTYHTYAASISSILKNTFILCVISCLFHFQLKLSMFVIKSIELSSTFPWPKQQSLYNSQPQYFQGYNKSNNSNHRPHIKADITKHQHQNLRPKSDEMFGNMMSHQSTTNVVTLNGNGRGSENESGEEVESDRLECPPESLLPPPSPRPTPPRTCQPRCHHLRHLAPKWPTRLMNRSSHNKTRSYLLMKCQQNR